MIDFREKLIGAHYQDQPSILHRGLLKYAAEQVIGEAIAFIEDQKERQAELTGPDGPLNTHPGGIDSTITTYISADLEKGLSVKLYAIRNALADELGVDNKPSFNFNSNSQAPSTLLQKVSDATNQIVALSGKLKSPAFK